jgi:hypothetical protein
MPAYVIYLSSFVEREIKIPFFMSGYAMIFMLCYHPVFVHNFKPYFSELFI